MKRIRFIITAAVLLLTLSFTVAALYENGEGIYSDTVYMENLDTGSVVFDIGSDEKVYPASLTKILTCIVAIEKSESLDATYEIPAGIFDDIYAEGGAHISLRAGEVVTISDLLHATLIRSACDSASALACYVSGSVDAFADEMNNFARKIGAKNTHFVNAHGLHDSSHYTTARDLAIITKYALQNKDFCDIISKDSYTIAETNKYAERYFESTMELELPESEHYYPYVEGIKSGFTDDAGRCLITKAEKNGESYLLVTLGANRDRYYNSNMAYTDAANLYEYAFAQYEIEKIIEAGVVVAEVIVENGVEKAVSLSPAKSVERLCAIDEVKQISFNIPESITAPVSKDTSVGTVTVSIGDETFTEPLFPAQDVAKEKKAVLGTTNTALSLLNFLTIIIYAASIVILVLFSLFFFKKSKSKK